VRRRLIVTADDLGLDLAVNEAVERALRETLLTCASRMPTGPSAADAVARARRQARAEMREQLERFRATGLALGRRIEARLRATCTESGRAGRALALHVLTWLVGNGQARLALRRMGAARSADTVLALESLVFVVRSLAFFVPGSIGVQEGSHALLGAALGLRPDLALAVLLVKRGREIVLGVPALAAWQAIEGRRLVRGG